MDSNIKKLMTLVKENPELPVVPMVDTDIVLSDDYGKWIANIGDSRVDNMYYSDYGRIYFDEDKDEIPEAELKTAKNGWQKVIVLEIETHS